MTLTVSDSVPALVAGNAVVLKPDSQTPYCALACAELLYRAGLPRALYAIVPGPLGGGHRHHRQLRLPDVHRFIGDRQPPRRARRPPAYRFLGRTWRQEPHDRGAGANLDKVAKAATRACFSNAGQLCISIERIYVERTSPRSSPGSSAMRCGT